MTLIDKQSRQGWTPFSIYDLFIVVRMRQLLERWRFFVGVFVIELILMGYYPGTLFCNMDITTSNKLRIDICKEHVVMLRIIPSHFDRSFHWEIFRRMQYAIQFLVSFIPYKIIAPYQLLALLQSQHLPCSPGRAIWGYIACKAVSSKYNTASRYHLCRCPKFRIKVLARLHTQSIWWKSLVYCTVGTIVLMS